MLSARRFGALLLGLLLGVGPSGAIAGQMYWTDGNGIHRAELDGTNIVDLVVPSGFARQIALDLTAGHMYWGQILPDQIVRSDLDGSNVTSLVTSGLDNPAGIALDPAGGKMYWTDGIFNKIERADLDGSNRETLVTGLNVPRYIALDVAGGKMYWAEQTGAKIRRANLDGSNVEPLVSLGAPYGIALDLSAGKMYWSDVLGGKIYRANLDGSSVESLVSSGISFPTGLALDLSSGTMFWTEQGGAKIQKADLDGSNVELVLSLPIAAFGIALDVLGGPACIDLDEDGFGSPGSPDCPSGSDEDCDDLDSSVFPGSPELCDGKDNDCDGAVPMDEDDLDEDGFRVCEGDCDDTDASLNPDALELPGNGVDENCDGSLGACDPTAEWRNHGQFVRCVAHEVNDLVGAGLITQEAGDDLVSAAAQSDVGK